MNELMIQGVRGRLSVDGNPELNLEDVARGLGFTEKAASGNVTVRWRTVRGYLLEFGIATCCDDSQQVRKEDFIPENIFYKLCFKAKNETAVAFQNLVTDEILPAIRKHGMYATSSKIEEMLNDPDTMIITLQKLKEERVRRIEAETTIEKQAPKVLFANAVEASHSTILIGELAKLLKQNGIDIGQNRLFERLRNDGYLIRRRGADYNMPTQKAMDLGLFKVKETAITLSDGHVSVNKTPKVTGKGQLYFINKYVNARLPGLLKGMREA